MLKTLPPIAILVATSSLHSPALEWSKDTTRHPWCRIGSDALSLCQGFTLPIWLLQLGGALAERSSEICFDWLKDFSRSISLFLITLQGGDTL